MYFYRKIFQKMIDWTENKGKSALFLEGARRVGKTTLALELGKNYFSNYEIIDFSKVDDDTKSIFKTIPDNLDVFYRDLFISLERSIPPVGSLIIFDEIQFCPLARQSIKTLVDDNRYRFIETGSLVSIKENVKDILIPSEEDRLEVYPMDYEEFLMAIGEDYSLNTIKDLFDHFDIISENKYHHSFMNQFRLYLAIGGMPQAVKIYVETKDLIEVHKEKNKILNLYKNDLIKIDAQYHTICTRMWDLIPSMLSHHNTRFRFSSIDIRSESLLIQNSIEKILESKIVNYVPMCSEPRLGFKLTESTNNFKLYYNDIGLFTAVIFNEEKKSTESIYKKLVFSRLDSNFGMLYENVVSQILVSSSYKPYYYSWKEDDKIYEIDFMITSNMNPVPIEVKKSKNFKTNSLDLLLKKNKLKEAYIVSPKSLNKDDKKIFIPFYMAHLV